MNIDTIGKAICVVAVLYLGGHVVSAHYNWIEQINRAAEIKQETQYDGWRMNNLVDHLNKTDGCLDNNAVTALAYQNNDFPKGLECTGVYYEENTTDYASTQDPYTITPRNDQ